MDIEKLTPLPIMQWSYGADRVCSREFDSDDGNPSCELVARFQNVTDAEVFVLMRSDLDVRLRRGWHTEIFGGDMWMVRQLHDIAEAKGVPTTAFWQYKHDVGLLTKADAWYKREIEGGR